ncbi:MAG: glycosyltransferase family 2 protein, partial [Flavobacteriales bacterium]|nr:glycosyltransferase family 2 protein [Flavobacteriales bacterium]
YNEQLLRNQDIELNKRIINNGGKIYLLPDATFIYYARETYKELFNNNFSNGFWNLLTVYITKDYKSLSLRHFIPLMFVLSLLFSVLIASIYPEMILLGVFVLTLYCSAVSYISLKLRNDDNSFCFLVLTFFVLHFSYGFGSLVGLLRVDKLMK